MCVAPCMRASSQKRVRENLRASASVAPDVTALPSASSIALL